MSVVFVLRMQVLKELLKIFALFCKTKINILKAVLSEVLEACSVEIIQPEKLMGQNTVTLPLMNFALKRGGLQSTCHGQSHGCSGKTLDVL